MAQLKKQNGHCGETNLSLNSGYFCFSVSTSFKIDGRRLLKVIRLIICVPTVTIMPPIIQRSIIAHSGSYNPGDASGGWVVVRLVKFAGDKFDVESILKTMKSV